MDTNLQHVTDGKASTGPECRFCLDNGLLVDAPVRTTAKYYVLESKDPRLPCAVMVVPFRHAESPFEVTTEEWMDFGAALNEARQWLEQYHPTGFTVGWNVGETAGQHVAHAHLHVVARFDADPAAGKGIRAALLRLQNEADLPHV